MILLKGTSNLCLTDREPVQVGLPVDTFPLRKTETIVLVKENKQQLRGRSSAV